MLGGYDIYRVWAQRGAKIYLSGLQVWWLAGKLQRPIGKKGLQKIIYWVRVGGRIKEC